MHLSQYREIWLEAVDGQLLCALINGNRGWLIYLRQSDDAGFSSRSLDYSGPVDAMIDYRLDNGQEDEYPASWALPIDDIERALAYFETESKPPPFVYWHNDSGDGIILEFNA